MKARKVSGLDPAGRLEDNLRRIVGVRLAELRSFGDAVRDPNAIEALHDMRIAAKRLRYVLEMGEPVLGAPAKRGAKQARRLQDLLGEIHDCDVMMPRVEAEIDRLRTEDARALLLMAGGAEDLDPGLVGEAPHRTAYRGLELLGVHLKARRALLFERFRDFWMAEASTTAWAELERAVEDRLQAAKNEPTPQITAP